MTRRTTCWIAFLVCLPCACAETKKPLFVEAPGSPIAVAGMPGNVAIADVNRDGKPDLIVASGKDKTVSVLLGQGDGQFRAAAGNPIAVPDHPSELVVRDLNGDGNADLALGSHNSFGVMLLWGDGKGGFALAANSPIVMREGKSPHTHGLDVGDLSGDGKLDLVTVNSDPNNDVSVAFGDGKGGFTRAAGSPFAVGPSPYPGTLADINGDGLLDIIATTTDRRKENQAKTRELTVLFGDGKGSFRRGQIPLRTPHPWFVAVGDVNGDGKPDLAVTHTEASKLTVLLGDGKGGFAEVAASPFDLGQSAWRMALADVNRDGHLDVIAAASTGVRVLFGDGKGGFAPAPGSPFATGKGTWQLAVGDLNGDGKIDVVATNLEDNSVTVLLGQ